MKSLLKSILHEPLFHFLLIACLLFFLSEESENNSIANPQITLESIDTNLLRSALKNSLQREPTPLEIEAFTKRIFYQELLLAEAIELNLHKEDALLKERLLEKMNQIIHATIPNAEIPEERLKAYYRANRDSYLPRESLSFYHVYFRFENAKNIKGTLEALEDANISAKSAASFGDIYRGGSYFKSMTQEALSKEFGRYFAQKVFRLKSGLWHKSVRSKYGEHLIYITEVSPKEEGGFHSVEGRVYEDYQEERLLKAKESFYRKLQE